MAYLAKHGVDKPEARKKAASALPDFNKADYPDMAPALLSARVTFRSIMVTHAERAAGGTNLNRLLQKKHFALAEQLGRLGLDVSDVRFPEDESALGKRVRASTFPNDPNPNPRSWESYNGERAVYKVGGREIERDLSKLAEWEAPDDSPASRARLARRESVAGSIECAWQLANGVPDYGLSARQATLAAEALQREAAALREIGLRPADITYPEDAKALGASRMDKATNAVSWDDAASIEPGQRFYDRKGVLQAETPSKGLFGLVQKSRDILREVEDRLRGGDAQVKPLLVRSKGPSDREVSGISAEMQMESLRRTNANIHR